jgi:uncharacterized protein (DUF305 family)
MDHSGHGGMPGMMSNDEMKDLMAATGADFDRMFLQMMIRHHEGAIEMAKTELDEGRYIPARDLAEGIVAGQQDEIDTMESLLD